MTSFGRLANNCISDAQVFGLFYSSNTTLNSPHLYPNGRTLHTLANFGDDLVYYFQYGWFLVMLSLYDRGPDLADHLPASLCGDISSSTA